MTDQHRATPEQWQELQHYLSAIRNPSIASCILELHDRIAALEAGQTCPHIVSSDEGTGYCALAEQTANQFRGVTEMAESSTPTNSLVERVAIALDSSCPQDEFVIKDVCTMIREVAAAARAKDRDGQDRPVMSWWGFARWLEQEAEQ
jgi:hypothetical protein